MTGFLDLENIKPNLYVLTDLKKIFITETSNRVLSLEEKALIKRMGVQLCILPVMNSGRNAADYILAGEMYHRDKISNGRRFKLFTRDKELINAVRNIKEVSNNFWGVSDGSGKVFDKIKKSYALQGFKVPSTEQLMSVKNIEGIVKLNRSCGAPDNHCTRVISEAISDLA